MFVDANFDRPRPYIAARRKKLFAELSLDINNIVDKLMKALGGSRNDFSLFFTEMQRRLYGAGFDTIAIVKDLGSACDAAANALPTQTGRPKGGADDALLHYIAEIAYDNGWLNNHTIVSRLIEAVFVGTGRSSSNYLARRCDSWVRTRVEVAACP